MLSPQLTPDGFLICEGAAEGALEKRLAVLADSEGALLAGLATEWLTAELDPSWRWVRGWGQCFFTRLCQAREARLVELPGAEECAAFVESAPPFTGAEYLSVTVLQRWWQAMAAHVFDLAEAHADGLDGWLREAGSAWHLVGRVTFHLAENKTDSQRPFAFLATFTERLGATGQPQHLPLARALQHYAGQKDQTALNALLEPVRTAAARSKLLQDWLASRRLFQPMAMSPREAFRVLRETAVFQESGIIMKLPDWWKSGRAARPVVAVTIDAPKQTTLHAESMLRFNIDRSLDGEPLTEAEWEKLMSAETGLVSLRGKWVEVDRSKLDAVMAHWQKVQQAAGEGGIGFLDGMKLLAGWDDRQNAAGDEAALEALPDWSAVMAGKQLARVLEQMRQPAAVPPPPELHATLRPYQARGFAWLQFMERLGLGACLADDMGLGKTVQVIALLLSRRQEQKKTALLVVPASLIGNWQAEAAKFAPALKILAAHPSAISRELLAECVSAPEKALKGHDAMLTTYGFLSRSASWQSHPWGLVVLDEAQAIKNPGSGVSKAVKRLSAEGRVVMTGTPVENRPGDLWSLFDFLNPGLLGSATAFARAVKSCAQNRSRDGFAPLRRLVQPYILRRMKTDKNIISDLPDKVEIKARCGLTKRQATLYAKLVDQLARMLNDEGMEDIQRRGLVLGFLLKFKQVCNHPSHWNGDGVWKPADSGKFARLGEITGELAARGEKALVFTQFQETCEPLARYLATVFQREGLVLHGGTAVKKRPQLVDAFQAPGGPPFMVISVKAGGTGLNLTAASHVIHFDRWWNPAVENQATDRAFRIGQQRKVMVHKFVCQGTIEERIDAIIEEKLALAQDLITGEGGAEKLLTDMSNDDLLKLVALDVKSIVSEED